MGDVPQPAPGIHGYQASSLLVGSRPNEMAFPLREEEFQTLCEGEISLARSNRDVCIGVAATAFVGLIGLLSIVDWGSAWTLGHRGWLLWLVLFLISLSAAGMGVCVYHGRLTRAQTDSAYSRLRLRIADWFHTQKLDGNHVNSDENLAILSARYGAGDGWLDVAPLLRAKIRDDKLQIRVTNEEFRNDPAPNIFKKLVLSYSHRGIPHQKVVEEGQDLSLP